MTAQEERIYIEQIRLSYQQGITLVLGAAIVAVAVTLYLWLVGEQKHSFYWLIAVWLIALIRIWCIYRYRKCPDHKKNWRRWGTLFWVGTFFSGFVWGVWWPLFYDAYNTETLLLLTTVFAGMCAVSAISGGTYPPTFFSFTLPLMLPFSIMHMLDDNGTLQITGVLMLLYTFVCSVLTLRSSESYRELISARFQNSDLMKSLEAEKQIAENAVVEKSRFLAAASHDLRQPLHAMGLFLAALRQRSDSDAQLQIIGNMTRSTDALNSLFNSLLDVSRLDAGMVSFEPGNLSCDALLEDLHAQFQFQVHAKGLKLDFDSGGQVLYTDKVLFERVLRNLISNAVQYTEKGLITVRCSAIDEKYVLVEVSDTGIGIPNSEIDSIFNEYYQLNNPERDRSKGLGLGLAIVKRLCKLTGLRISVSSDINSGTKFEIIVPRGKVINRRSHYGSSISHSTPEGMHMLIVDDELQVLDGMQCMLESWGCRVTRADSARDAIKQLSMSPGLPDLLICDYRLRDNKTGLDAVAVVNEFLATQLPAIIVTGDTSLEIQTKVLTNKLHVLHKPVSEQQLLEAISSIT